MFLWFLFLSCVGLYNIAISNSATLSYLGRAFDPWEAIRLLAGMHNGPIPFSYSGLQVLASLVLCVTGIEDLYAELGSYTKIPIRLSWIVVVFPSLLINYFGQVATLIREPDSVRNPFFMSIPQPIRIVGVILAAFASITASQGSISGSFSLLNQSVALRYFPQINIRHTSSSNSDQVYIPLMNWFLMISACGLVLGYHNSLNLALAYGAATSSAMFFTSLLFILVQVSMLRVAPCELYIARYTSGKQDGSTWCSMPLCTSP